MATDNRQGINAVATDYETTMDAMVTDNRQLSTDNWPVYRSTHEMIEAIRAGSFPTKAMMTFHP